MSDKFWTLPKRPHQRVKVTIELVESGPEEHATNRSSAVEFSITGPGAVVGEAIIHTMREAWDIVRIDIHNQKETERGKNA
jgi:hypothetical protein